MIKHCLLVSDFDQTLSFDDTGVMLSEMLGITGFEERVAGLSRLNLVQEGAELTYLLRHDPEYRRVRRDDLIEVGRHVHLKRNIGDFVVETDADGLSVFLELVDPAAGDAKESYELFIGDDENYRFGPASN